MDRCATVSKINEEECQSTVHTQSLLVSTTAFCWCIHLMKLSQSCKHLEFCTTFLIFITESCSLEGRDQSQRRPYQGEAGTNENGYRLFHFNMWHC